MHFTILLILQPFIAHWFSVVLEGKDIRIFIFAYFCTFVAFVLL